MLILEDTKVVAMCMTETTFNFITSRLRNLGHKSIEEFFDYSLLLRIPELTNERFKI